ncbi:NAD(P)-dependent glycerol-3-phosphate dehydrogenase [Stappia sp. F7233]|uniref:Glycerol-3-phosphate dehydrogenase [NAD(P)+] n=1 Tax=Stappia albiluteola TaxID=2758565 RepID=A0A839AHU0_9HYPH|nr:NAD(P)H-dependent glycerol-3-phosphate dehydrogenase [Stappia albiluteola]MBA5778482.1 NAD(P)-dependent glycerol-3-phosphate dehydrogenase [Stappia albiluteola]
MAGIRRIAVIGGGAWGTALALVAARAGRDVALWARDAATVDAINGARENPRFLPGITFDRGLVATTELETAMRGADAVLLVTPAQTTREVAGRIAPFCLPGAPVILAAKGIERGSGLLLSDVLREALPEAVPAALSGPSFAADVARKLPTAVTIAAGDETVADALSAALASPSFRPYASGDLIGVQVGGALKNVLAIACGAVEGRGWGASARAALTARGFVELSRLGAALGARPETLTGLSGLGDLVLTCSSEQSRNFAFGIALGKAGTAPMAQGGKLAEGVFSAQVAVDIGKRHGVELPISGAVAAVLGGSLSLDDALEALMTRPLKRES